MANNSDTSQTKRIERGRARRTVAAAGLLCAIVLGVLAFRGSLAVPEAERATLGGARAALHAEMERLESMVPAGRAQDDGLWRAYLDVVAAELELGHIDVAVRAWQDAYGAALASRSWESMIAVGDAFMTIGRASGTPKGARMNAREAYLTALIRARRDHSVEGAIRSAEAFQALDERVAVEQCLHIAAQFATGSAQAEHRVQEARQRWAARQTVTVF